MSQNKGQNLSQVEQAEPSETPVPTTTPTHTPKPTSTQTPTRTQTPVRTATATPSRTPHSGLLPLGDPKPEANFVLARYNQKSIPHVAMSMYNLEPLSQTIDYTYDPLGRLTAADYSTGDYYHYSYDEVGNRVSQISFVNNLQTTTGYTYDIANRLAQVGNNTYTWDNNGNMLNDGMSTYTYDTANRLSSVQQGNNSYSFSYNGLGDRLQQTINSQTTSYTLDLNTGLTQVLDDGTDTYLYGVDRIAQIGSTNTDYFLGDALGSVRQLTDKDGVISLSRNYDPYGVTTQNLALEGIQTSYAYTGEAVEENGLAYLRARYYSGDTGRFISRDSWDGDASRPMSYDRWAYVEGNPINFTDPSGHDPWWCDGLARNVCLEVYNGQPVSFNPSDDYSIQSAELRSYVMGQPTHSIMQADLNNLPKTSQYNDIDSSESGYGANACGFVAAASASGEDLKEAVRKLAEAAGSDYGNDTGIQPSKFVKALKKVFDSKIITAHDKWTLGDMYRSLQHAEKVIVDIKVEAGVEVPSAQGKNFAHFARVLGIDIDANKIYIQNTLSGSPYWSVPLDNFWEVWKYPESSATIIPKGVNPEPVTRWAVTMK